MTKKIILLLFPLVALSQPMRWETQTIPVEVDSSLLPIPWTGGMSDPKCDFVDIDGDGDYDVFIGDNSGKLWYIENIGLFSAPIWEFKSDFYDSINLELNSSPSFCDIDSDEDQDLFSVGYGIIGFNLMTIWYFLNIGNENLAIYSFVTDTIASAFWCQGIDFGDIDNDGDFDLLKGWTGGGGLSLYENFGDSSQFIFNIDTLILSTSSHNYPNFCDIDNDNDLDIVYGLGTGQVNLLRNDGTPTQYNFTVVTQNLVQNVGIDAAPTLVDIDGDGDLDLFVGTGVWGWFTPFGGIWYFENIGTPQQYNFQYRTKSYFDIDTGYRSVPRLVDIDADGDLDLFITNANGRMSFWRNEGTVSNPQFVLIDEWYQSLAMGGNSSIEFADLDADGDWDLLSGYCSDVNGLIVYYENQGSPSQANYVQITSNLLNTIYTLEIAPATCDIDNDGDYDLFVGKTDGTISYYRNEGNTSNFHFVLQTNNYFNIDVGSSACPFFYDIDSDGDYDMFIGYNWGLQHGIYFYENTGTMINANFVFRSFCWENILVHSGLTAPCFSDIDNDGDADLFIGSYDGGVAFYRNLSDNPPLPQVYISVNGNSTILSWEAYPSAEAYKIYYSNDPYFIPSGTPQAIVQAPATSWTDWAGLGVGKRYYRVVVEY